jgi:hypothetical protein
VSVVDWHARACAQRPIALHHGRPSAVGEDQIVLGNERSESVAGVLFDARQRCGRVDVPKGNDLAGAPLLQHGSFQQRIENADSTRLHQQVRASRRLQRALHAVLTRVDHDSSPRWHFQIAVLLPVEGIGFIKNSAVTTIVQRFDYPSVVRRGAVPIRRQQARTEKADIQSHALTSTLRSFLECDV